MAKTIQTRKRSGKKNRGVMRGGFINKSERSVHRKRSQSRTRNTRKTRVMRKRTRSASVTKGGGCGQRQFTPLAFTPLAYGRIYSDVCGHCNHMKPAWNTLCANMGKKCRKTKRIDIGEDYHTQTKIKDQLENPYELQQFTYQGVPTIYRIPKQGTVELYEGERTPEKMMSWMIKSPVK